jgi:hypothetical protein
MTGGIDRFTRLRRFFASYLILRGIFFRHPREGGIPESDWLYALVPRFSGDDKGFKLKLPDPSI